MSAPDAVEVGGQVLLHGDCLAVLPTLADASFDMVLADLPYGSTQNRWDTCLPLDVLWRELRRVRKSSAAVVLTATQPFTSVLVCSNLREFKYAWVWHKSSVTGHLNAHRRPMRNHEDVLVFSDGSSSYYPQDLIPFQKIKRRDNNGPNFGRSGAKSYQESTNYPRTIIRLDGDQFRSHPTQKPVALFEYFIRTYTREGDTVLDVTSGVGTTAVAAHRCGRRATCIEMDQTYHERAVERLCVEVGVAIEQVHA